MQIRGILTAAVAVATLGSTLGAVAADSVADSNIAAIYETRQDIRNGSSAVNEELESVIEARIAQWLDPSLETGKPAMGDASNNGEEQSVVSSNINAIFAPNSAS